MCLGSFSCNNLKRGRIRSAPFAYIPEYRLQGDASTENSKLLPSLTSQTMMENPAARCDELHRLRELQRCHYAHSTYLQTEHHWRRANGAPWGPILVDILQALQLRLAPMSPELNQSLMWEALRLWLAP